MRSSTWNLVRRALPASAAIRLSGIGKALAAAALWGACSLAQAGVLSFDDLQSRPLTASSEQTSGQYWFQAFDGNTTPSDVLGAIIDGSNASSCPTTFTCPVGHASTYFATLNDGYFYFGLQNGGLFHLNSLQASFIGEVQSQLLSTPGGLAIAGFSEGGVQLGELQFSLPGLRAGNFTFADFSLAKLSSYEFSYVRILAYACNVGGNGNCTRTSGFANVAFDNIVTTEVPEPGTLALVTLALAGFGWSRRRRG